MKYLNDPKDINPIFQKHDMDSDYTFNQLMIAKTAIMGKHPNGVFETVWEYMEFFREVFPEKLNFAVDVGLKVLDINEMEYDSANSPLSEIRFAQELLYLAFMQDDRDKAMEEVIDFLSTRYVEKSQ